MTPLREFEHYTLLGQIAEGGMGVVYQAVHRGLNRSCALKLIRTGLLATPDERRRFVTEAEAAARLDHPNIVRVGRAAEFEGQWFLEMELVEGGTLADRLAEGPLPAQDTAQLVERLARAAHHAHERGVLHRDLKPANVLLATDGQPKLTDFGLARFLEKDSDLTRTVAVLGTPAYLAPELASGRAREATTSADVYSLGVILFECLTGQRPFQGQSPLEILRAVQENTTPHPSTLRRDLPLDLETICLKCLEKEPAKRYPTAQALADELHRFLHDEPIHARPVGRVEKAWRWCRRKPALAASLAALSLALTLGFIGVLTQWQRAERQWQRAERQSHRAEANAANERRERYYASIAAADSHIRNGDIDPALNLLTNCPPEFRHWEWGRLLYLCHQSISTTRLTNSDLETLIVNSAGTRLCGSIRGAAVCWDIESGREIIKYGDTTNSVTAMAFSLDGHWLAVARLDGALVVWDADSGLERVALTVSNRVETIIFNPGASEIFVTTRDRRCSVWNVATGAHLMTTPAADKYVTASALGPGRRVWATMDDRGAIAFRDATTGVVHASARGTNSYTPLTISKSPPLVFSPDGRKLIANQSAYSSRIWEVETGREVANIPVRIYAAAFTPDGQHLATLSGYNTAEVWNVATGENVLTLRGHRSTIRELSFAESGRKIVTASDDGEVRTWRADAGRERFDHDFPVDSVAFHPDGRRFVSTQMDGVARLWDGESGSALRAWRGNGSWCRAACFSPDGRRILTAGADDLARVWDTGTGTELLTLRGHDSAIRDAVFSPDGSRIATASWDRTCRIWDAQTGRPLHTLTGASAGLRPIVFSPDGRRVAAADVAGLAHVWDIETGQPLLTLRASSSPLFALVFSPDGRRIVTGSSSRSIRVWDSATGENVARWVARSHVQWLHFSADGRRLVVLTAHRLSWLSFATIEIWDPETGRQILTMPGRDALVFSAQFSPDGRRLLTGSSDYTARQWEAFPWREEDYSGDSAEPFLQRVQLHAREYWRRRVDAERSATRTATPSIPSESLRSPKNAWPSRDAQADARLVDLTGHYNAFLNFPAYLVSYELDFDNDLSALPTGVLTLSNTMFDVRGAILLQAAPRPVYSIYEKKFLPEVVREIPVNARFRRFCLLHATQNTTGLPENTPVYGCVLHYADGQQREIEVLFGRDVRDWWQLQEDSKPETDRGIIVWRGANTSATRQAATLRLYKTAFDNPRPAVEVRSMDFISKFAKGNPFLIAVTIDP